MVFRILPPEFRAKASAEGPCGKRALQRRTGLNGSLACCLGQLGSDSGSFSIPAWKRPMPASRLTLNREDTAAKHVD